MSWVAFGILLIVVKIRQGEEGNDIKFKKSYNLDMPDDEDQMMIYSDTVKD